MMGVVQFLNWEPVKEGIKYVAGTLSFTFGLVELYDIYQIVQGREVAGGVDPNAPEWVQVASKVVIVCAKISLILSAGVSRPGVFVISIIVGQFFTTAQLEAVFGPNTTFALNPWHPRHICSLAAAILALPAAIQLLYQGVNWICREIEHFQDQPQDHWLTNAHVRMMALFNTVTGRPILHIGNRVAHYFN